MFLHLLLKIYYRKKIKTAYLKGDSKTKLSLLFFGHTSYVTSTLSSKLPAKPLRTILAIMILISGLKLI
jgi:hypothetical protein